MAVPSCSALVIVERTPVCLASHWLRSSGYARPFFSAGKAERNRLLAQGSVPNTQWEQRRARRQSEHRLLTYSHFDIQIP